jgi:decaprenylphospho-beta-D-erythro-pentofuranosid-2-ulose 2-reductase
MTENLELPRYLTASPDQVAFDIIRAIKKSKNVVYTKWIWQYIMLVIKAIPEFIFKRFKF